MSQEIKGAEELIKELAALIEGAPYPTQINNELYTIWYERAIPTAIDAMRFIHDNFPDERR